MSIPALVSSSYCVPHSTQFEVNKKLCFSPDKYTVTGEGNLVIFRVKAEGVFAWQRKKTIYDAFSGEVLLVLKKEVPCCGQKLWVAFRGNSESESQVLFAVSKKPGAWCSSSVVFQVFLPENNNPANPDFTMEARSWRSTYTILFHGTPLAKGRKTGWGVSDYDVQVYPEVDRAFIAALSIIWSQERVQRTKRRKNAVAAAAAAA